MGANTEKNVNWDSIAADTPVWVKSAPHEAEWTPRHFSHVDKEGHVYVYPKGKTSHTCTSIADEEQFFPFVRLTEPK